MDSAAWLDDLDATIQPWLARVGTMDHFDEAATAARLLCTNLPEPRDAMQAAALSTRLLIVCARVVDAAHVSVPSRPCGCHMHGWSFARSTTNACVADVRALFCSWLDTFLAAVALEHPQSACGRAADLIRSDPMKAWRVAELAGATGEHPATLRGAFSARYGMRVADYIQLVRATRAVSLFSTATKVEAVAWEVGYRSKKDLYAALARWVGATPTEIRRLSTDERTWLEGQLQAVAMRGVDGGAGSASGETRGFLRRVRRPQSA